jgi:hypothetical protein
METPFYSTRFRSGLLLRSIPFSTKLLGKSENRRLPLHCCNTCGSIHTRTRAGRLYFVSRELKINRKQGARRNKPAEDGAQWTS